MEEQNRSVLFVLIALLVLLILILYIGVQHKTNEKTVLNDKINLLNSQLAEAEKDIIKLESDNKQTQSQIITITNTLDDEVLVFEQTLAQTQALIKAQENRYESSAVCVGVVVDEEQFTLYCQR